MTAPTHPRSHSPAKELDTQSCTRRRILTWDNKGIAQLSQWIGGPFGVHGTVGRQAFFTPLRILLCCAILGLVLGFGSKVPCLQQVTNASGAHQVVWDAHTEYLRLCYSDIVPLYASEGFDQHAVPYFDHRQDRRWMEYPVALGFFQYAAAVLTHAVLDGVNPPIAPEALFFVLCALGITCAWLVVVRASALLAGDRVWDVWLIALSPVVFVQAFTNFDALGIACMMMALVAWHRHAPGVVGVCVGLGAAIKLFPAMLLFPILLVAWREKRLAMWGRAVVSAVCTYGLINLPVAVMSYTGWKEFFIFNQLRVAQEGSLLYVLNNYLRPTLFQDSVRELSVQQVNSVSLISCVLLCLGIAAIVRYAKRPVTLEEAVFLTMTALLLTSKVWSSQYSLWLVPLVVLVTPRIWLVMSWMVLEFVNWCLREWWMYTSFYPEKNPLMVQQWYLLELIARDAVLVGICVAVILPLFQVVHAPQHECREESAELVDGPELVYTGRPST